MSSLVFFFWLTLIFCKLKICVLQPNLKESIFESDFCDVKCAKRQHTMCHVPNLVAECADFEYHDFQKDDAAELMETLIQGHNGVRNRIAERMNLPNMIEMIWDVKLARMAENFLHRCVPTVADPCTLSHIVFEEEETINEFFKFNHSQAYIVQNMYREKGTFYPYKFLERVIRAWYFEKDGMRAPTKVSDVDNDIKRLLGENNFTHFAYPFIYRFGCGMARFDETFHILCNYYPFYRTLANSMYFQTGKPATTCPARFPLRGELFNSLCTGSSPSKNGTERRTSNFCNTLSMLLFLLLLALLLKR